MSEPSSPCTIAAAGDAIVTRRLNPYAESDQGIGSLRSVINDTDAAVANLEVVLPARDAAATPLPPVPSQYQTSARWLGS